MQFLSTYFTISTVRDLPLSHWNSRLNFSPKEIFLSRATTGFPILARFVWHIVFFATGRDSWVNSNPFNRASINLTPGRPRSEKSPCVGKIYVIFDSTSNVVKKNFSWNFFIWRKLVDQNFVHAEKKHKSRIFNKNPISSCFLYFWGAEKYPLQS